jgi:MFS family permease
LYQLYHHHGFVETQVAVIYVCGIISSAVFFPAKDIITSKLGRRKTAVVFCALYILSCLLMPIPRYSVLIIGRCIAGLTNSILFSTLESWYVHEHLESFDFPKEWLPLTFSHVAFGSSVVAVLAGFMADIAARWLSLGPVAPFVLAVPVFVASMVCLLVLWTENFSEKKEISQKTISKSCSEGLKTILQNFDLFLVGAIQSLFESVVFVFVFIWTPALNVYGDISLGVAFASFMVCFLLGGIVCDYLIAKVGYTMTRLLVLISAAGCIVFLVAAYVARSREAVLYRFKMLVCLQVFELICGFYFPIMRVLRKKVLPEEHSLSVTNWFRVPLTVLSSLALLCFHNTSGGIPEIFLFCAAMMAATFACSFRFAGIGRTGSEHSEEA